MATQAQILANRRNAQKSTGPRTPRGKAVVSQNSVKHGLSARQAVISSEKRADFDLYRNQILTELAPVTPMETILAERIVNLSWRLKRTIRIQNRTIDALHEDNIYSPFPEFIEKLRKPSKTDPKLALGSLAIKDFSYSRVLDRLLMYERRLENSLYRTILELQRIRIIKKLDTECEIPIN